MSNRARWDHLQAPLDLVVSPGDFAELGVWRGETFLPMAAAAAKEKRIAHAVDSFRGMLKSTLNDIDEQGRDCYPEGALSAGGPEALRKATAEMPNVRIHVGFIPQVLRKVKPAAGLALVHIDLDQYKPTLAAMAWAWPRINAGGVLAMHDYWPGRGCLASKAIDEFLRAEGLTLTGRNPESSHAWIRKGVA